MHIAIIIHLSHNIILTFQKINIDSVFSENNTLGIRIREPD